MSLRHAFLRAPLLLAFAVLGCGGSSEPEPIAAEDTSGGETVVTAEPVATTPIPVPQTPVPRDRLSAPLRDVWTRTERAIEVRPPDPPSEGTEEAIDAWAETVFRPWLEARLAATNEAQIPMNEMHAAPAYERGVGAALFGYLYEDMASGVRGAPVPEHISADPELLAAYIGALHEAVGPAARLAAKAYALCANLLEPIPDWAEWGSYCRDRGLEVIEVFSVPLDENGNVVDPPPATDDATAAGTAE
jgi:hypothetical protein